MADRILGSQFLADIAEFFVLFQTMHAGFVERADAVTRVLSDRRTTFAVVTTLEAAPVAEAEFFIDALAERDLHLGAIVFNKALPAYLRSTAATKVARDLLSDLDATAARVTPELHGADVTPAAVGRVLGEVAESFLNYQVVAKREADLRKDLASAAEVVATVPYLDDDVHDLNGLLGLGRAFWR
jgi:anion-transporting  ArsA/GET3 family ATPase